MKAIFTLCLAFAVSSCATTGHYSHYTQAGYEDAFKGAIKALEQAQYDIVESDKAEGVIVGERGLDGSRTTGQKIRVRLTLEKKKTGVNIQIRVIPPPRSVGSSEPEYRELRASLEKALAKYDE